MTGLGPEEGVSKYVHKTFSSLKRQLIYSGKISRLTRTVSQLGTAAVPSIDFQWWGAEKLVADPGHHNLIGEAQVGRAQSGLG